MQELCAASRSVTAAWKPEMESGAAVAHACWLHIHRYYSSRQAGYSDSLDVRNLWVFSRV
jgi:hypothetical protein